MVAAMRADFFGGVELAMKDHLLAGGALMPEIIRHIRAAKKSTDFRADKFSEPGHRKEISGDGGRKKVRASFLKKRSKKLLAFWRVQLS